MWAVDYFRYAWYDLQRMREVRKIYYRDPKFAAIDRAILRKYLLRSPYRISRRYLKYRREEDLHTYGETPLSTLERIAKWADIQPGDTVLELGCGRGRGVFFLSHFYRCRVIGIERIPQFVKLAKHVAFEHCVKSVHFTCANMLEIKWPQADLVYLYGTCLRDQEINQVVRQLAVFPKKTRVISVSYPLVDDTKSNAFELQKTFSVSFPWGETEAFLQEIK